jgi:hypothetical protein
VPAHARDSALQLNQPSNRTNQTAVALKQQFLRKKNPPQGRDFSARLDQLLDLAFLVDHVLTDSWIEFFDFELIRGGAFVLVSGVEVAGTGT